MSGTGAVEAVSASCFDRSWYVPAVAKRHLADRLEGYLHAAAECVRQVCAGAADLYLAGSLARSEGAVARTAHGYVLASDLDFVAVVADGYRGPDPVAPLIDHLTGFDPAFLPTCFVLECAHLARVRSHFGHDLWQGSRRPLLISSGSPRPVRPEVGPREALEVVVHQLASYLLTAPPPDGPGGESPRTCSEHHRMKLLLELLRATITAPGQQVPGYADLITAGEAEAFAPVADAARVRALVRSRELSRPVPITVSAGDALAVGLLQLWFGCPVDHRPGPGLIEALLERGSGRSDVMSLFQLCLILYYLFTRAPQAKVAGAAADALGQLWSQLTEDELIEARGQRAAIVRLTPQRLARRRRADLSVLHRAMVRLRCDYYHYLGPYNFGKIPYPAYAGYDPQRSRS
ncbi:hypothetical protein [Planomonospora parontospora]|uniref:hypothetical protein n=1 Tax=Planomonospora parontospora TaxID=58119 RepID=UPI0016717BAF|nr:hypothetical protein [Planomonospora parontospora]GGL54907.1 hypothetical protein GCM10014719_65240 [Planomonospora parontospora subsp. antibiotica]GII19287.1 hypothetical protein Ppa05_60130 [Planomonospora parontospora subsp. antibiotica]